MQHTKFTCNGVVLLFVRVREYTVVHHVLGVAFRHEPIIRLYAVLHHRLGAVRGLCFDGLYAVVIRVSPGICLFFSRPHAVVRFSPRLGILCRINRFYTVVQDIGPLVGAMVLFPVVYYLTNITERYRFPLESLLVILASVGLLWVIARAGRWSSGSHRSSVESS